MFTITPGSEQVRYTIARDGLIETFTQIGGNVFANACGPVSDNGNVKAQKKVKRTLSFIHLTAILPNVLMVIRIHMLCSVPEIVTALAIAGDLTFNPINDI